MPLCLGRLRLVHLQPILDRARSHLAGWKGRWVNAGGRRALVMSVLSALPIFAMTPLKIPPKFFKVFDKLHRNFLWNIQDDEAVGGKCKVSWVQVCMPLSCGGLGLPNLTIFGRALRLQWLWLEWSEPRRPWVGMPTPCDEEDLAFFHIATRMTLGDGTVAAATINNAWVRDLGARLPQHLLHDFVGLWRLVHCTVLRPDIPDSIRWILSSNGSYSSSSAYNALFEGQVSSIAPAMIWRVWALAKCKKIAWLLLNNRLWCADRLLRRGWPNNYFCPLCVRNLETAWHIFFECLLSRKLWQEAAAWPHCGALVPSTWASATDTEEAWKKMMEATLPQMRQSMFLLICSAIWKERNDRIFRNRPSSMAAIVTWIRDEARDWAFANAKALRELMFEPL
ncbi:hypothetical protein ACQ4PT_055368 [Festuca glaucescens]